MPDRPNFPIPDNINAELMCLQLMIPNDPTWKSVVAGLLYELQYWFNWQRDDEQSGRQCAAVWKGIYSSIDWSTMSCCCDQQILYRWTIDGVLQKSTDNGENWEDAPESDPRNNSTQYPPMSGEDGSDKRCLAATSAAQLIKSQVGDNLTDDMSRFSLNELIKTWVDTYIQTSNPFLALINIAVNQIFALVIAALRVALTDPVYATLQCIVYCNIGDDASISNAQWVLIRADITAQIGGIAGVFLEHLIYLLGVVGTANICRSGFATTSDCSECPSCTDVCSENFVAYTEGEETWGTVTERNDTSVTIEGTLHAGSYYAFLQTGIADLCCLPDNAEVISGTVDTGVIHWNLCGETGFGNHSGLFTYGSICVNWLAYQSASPFVVKVSFSECP